MDKVDPPRTVLIDAEFFELLRDALDVARDVVESVQNPTAERRLKRFTRLYAKMKQEKEKKRAPKKPALRLVK